MVGRVLTLLTPFRREDMVAVVCEAAGELFANTSCTLDATVYQSHVR